MCKDETWNGIINYSNTVHGKLIPILNPNTNSPFVINEISDDYIKIDKLRDNKLTKQMFLAVYNFVKSKMNWVRIGASRVNTSEDTVEGLLKQNFFNNNQNGLSTATWVSAVLVYSDVGIAFNNKAKGQKIRFKKQIMAFCRLINFSDNEHIQNRKGLKIGYL